MTDRQEQIVGILGGMGPEATVDFMRRIINNTPAEDDIDHIHCLVDNNPKVPSRIRAIIEGTGDDPAPAMQAMARRLEAGGADFLVIACNTAHYYYDHVRRAVDIPVLNMIDVTVKAALQAKPDLKKAGILASPAIRLTRQYEAPLAARGVGALYPAPEEEARLFAVIKSVKRGDTGAQVKRNLAAVIAAMLDQKAELCIVACTELGVILEKNYAMPVLDASEALARAVVLRAKP